MSLIFYPTQSEPFPTLCTLVVLDIFNKKIMIIYKIVNKLKLLKYNIFI